VTWELVDNLELTAIFLQIGPALLAFTLMMCAYSLRTWRRNGVACDELLFLPGTNHGQNNGIDAPLVEPPPPPQSPKRTLSGQSPDRDIASGRVSFSVRQRRSHSVDDIELPEVQHDELQSLTNNSQNREKEEPDSLSIESPERSDEIEEDSELNNSQFSDETDCNPNTLLCRTNSAQEGGSTPDDDTTPTDQPNAVQRWRDSHPHINRIGSFFFFRSSNTTTENAAYAPSGPSVFGAGLDLSMPILFNFHLFIEAYNHIQSSGSDYTAKILPLIFLSVLIVRTAVPPSRRVRFWSTLKFTFTAPLHHVRFRDEFIGDVLTSLVRPGQDIFFALTYYVTVVYGTASGNYGLEESVHLLNESWLLHNVILPSCAILPLWWKYLQTLRQAYDANRRWPYQGNSLKYLASTLVIIYGMTHPEDRRSPWWIVCFGLTLAYQVWWDMVMDWDLLYISREGQMIGSEQESWCTRISSMHPNSTILLRLQVYVLQPVLDACQRVRAQIPYWSQIQLRPRRLYKTDAFYWKIAAFNLVMRFTWMVCFIPAYHFSRERKFVTASSDTHSYFGVILPVAEILRRTFWGFLCLERETINMMDSDAMYSRVEVEEESSEEDDDQNSKTGLKSFRAQLLPMWLDAQHQVAHEAATITSKEREVFMRQLFVAELFVWAAAFIILGCWAAS
jgi:hypothetical protein